MNLIFNILLALLLSPFYVYGDNSRESLEGFFNKDEINDINLLINRFDDYIQEDYEGSDLSNAYENFFEAMAKSEAQDDLSNVAIPYEQKKQMVDGLQKSTLSKIWEHHRFKNTNIETDFYLNYNGKYMEFLREAGKKNLLIKEYYDSIETAGVISPYSFSLLNHKQKELDISDKRIRFILAVHYLTLRIPT